MTNCAGCIDFWILSLSVVNVTNCGSIDFWILSLSVVNRLRYLKNVKGKMYISLTVEFTLL